MTELGFSLTASNMSSLAESTGEPLMPSDASGKASDLFQCHG